MSTSAKLEGFPILASHPVTWTLRYGTAPHQQMYEMTLSNAERLHSEKKGKPVTLEIDQGPGTAPLIVKQLYVVGLGSQSTPYTRGVMVSDLRWMLPRILIFRRYNVRRRTGNRRRLLEDNVPPQIVPIEDDVAYAPWSLGPDGKPWQPDGVLSDVFTEIAEQCRTILRTRGKLREGVAVENLFVGDAGDGAAMVVLKHFPGVDFYVDYDGAIVLEDTLNGRENDVLKNLGGAVVGTGLPNVIDFAATRPSRVRVYVVREMEVRFDAVVSGATTVKDDRFMTNVISIPDFTLTVSGVQMPQGTWAEINAVMSAWNSTKPPGAEDISDTVVRQAWFFGLWQHYTQLGILSPDADWILRIGTLRTHYRQTYQLNRRWVDRSLSIVANRVSIQNPETGTRAPSPLWTDFCVIPTAKGLIAAGEQAYFAENIEGYGGEGAALNAKNADGSFKFKLAPAVVRMLDGELGIVRFDYQLDLFGRQADIVPSFVDNVPTGDLADPAKPKHFGHSPGGAPDGMPTLRASHGLATILTLTPASPNSKTQLEMREYTPTEVKDLLPSSLVIEGGKGPVYEVLVSAGYVTARYAWTDSKAAAVEEVFGVRPAAPGQNVILDNPVNDDHVQAVGRAVAAAVYAAFSDRVQGAKTVRLDPSLVPTGRLSSVTHTLDTEGAGLTTVQFMTEVSGIDVMAMVPDGIRRVLLSQVQP